MKVFFSNRLEILADRLQDRLFLEEASPFAKRTVVVPSLLVKNFLLYRWAKEMGVATGIKVVSISQIMAEPSFLELSLLLEDKVEKEGALAEYLNGGDKKRLHALCDTLSSLFLRYKLYGGEALKDWKRKEGWQQNLWQEMEEKIEIEGELFLFHFSFLPKPYLEFFKKHGAEAFFLSPSQMYWGDVTSKREQYFLSEKIYTERLKNRELGKEASQIFCSEQATIAERLRTLKNSPGDCFSGKQVNEVNWPEGGASESKKFETKPTPRKTDFSVTMCIKGITFEEQIPLLGDLGKMGRNFLTFLEGDEEYEEPKGEGFLHQIQKEILTLEESEKIPDDSVQVRSAPSKMREVEALLDVILKLKIELKDFLVLAPDITEYVPYIHYVFRSLDYAIFDLEYRTESLLAKGLECLLKGDFLELFSFGNFLEKFKLSSEDAAEILQWIKKANFRNDWERGIDRLLFSLVSTPEEGFPRLGFTDAPLLAKLVEIFQLLQSKLSFTGEKTMTEWMSFFIDLAETFFTIQSEDELLIKEFRSFDRIEDLKFSYESMERVLKAIFGKKTGSFQAGHLHAIRFASLGKGTSIPADAICLLGMEEDLFPRKEKKTSLCEIEGDYKPTITEEDRYLFLELLLSARKFFLLFFTNTDPEDGREKEASSLVQKFISMGVQVQDHPPKDYLKAPSLQPLFSFEPQKKTVDTVHIRDLKEFARHPLRYFFERTQGISFEYEENKYPEFILSNKDLSFFRRLNLPATEVLAKAEKMGILPKGAFGEVAKMKIAALEQTKTFSIDVDLQIGSTHVIGRLNDVTEEGLLFQGEDCLEDCIKAWPLYLIFLQVRKEGKLLFSKSGEFRENFFPDPREAFERYLSYYECANPSPLLPSWAKAFLQGEKKELEKAMRSSKEGFYPDEVVRFLTLPPAESLHEKWAPLLKEVFREIV